MAKVLGGESLRAFGYQQMREERDRQRQEDMLRKTQGGLGASLMALSGDMDAGDADDRNTLNYLGLAASADTGPIGQIASAIGKIKGMGAIEKKREAERGRKDVMSKMLLGGATDLSLDEISELEGQSPEFIKKVVDYKRSEADRLESKEREAVLFEQKKDLHEMRLAQDIQAYNQTAKLNNQYNPEQHFYENFDEYITALEGFTDADGEPLIDENNKLLYKDYQSYKQLVNNKVLPMLQDDATAERIFNTYRQYLPREITSPQDLKMMRDAPPALVQAMITQMSTTRKMPVIQELDKRIVYSYEQLQKARRGAQAEVDEGYRGAAEMWLRQKVQSIDPDDIKNSIYGDMLIEDSGLNSFKLGNRDFKIQENARNLILQGYLGDPVAFPKESQENRRAMIDGLLAEPAAQLRMLTEQRAATVGSNDTLRMGYQIFDSEEQQNAQIPRMKIGTVFEAPNGGLMKVEVGDFGGKQLKEAVPLTKDEAERFRNTSMRQSTPFFMPTVGNLDTLFKQAENPKLKPDEAKQIRNQISEGIKDLPDGDVKDEQMRKFEDLLKISMAMPASDDSEQLAMGGGVVPGIGGLGALQTALSGASLSGISPTDTSTPTSSLDDNFGGNSETNSTAEADKGFLFQMEDDENSIIPTVTAGSIPNTIAESLNAENIGEVVDVVGPTGLALGASAAAFQTFNRKYGTGHLGVIPRGDKVGVSAKLKGAVGDKVDLDEMFEDLKKASGSDKKLTRNQYFDNLAKEYNFRGAGTGRVWTSKELKKLGEQMERNFIMKRGANLFNYIKKSPRGKRNFRDADDTDGSIKKGAKTIGRSLIVGGATGMAGMSMYDIYNSLERYGDAIPDKVKQDTVDEGSKVDAVNTFRHHMEANETKEDTRRMLEELGTSEEKLKELGY